jgi:hypothetical protein
MDDPDRLRTLLELERRGWDALCDGTGDDFYGRVMTDDAVMVLADGSVMDRPTVVASLGHAPPWRTYEIGDPRLVGISPDTTCLVYLGRAYREGDQPAFTAVMTSVYVRSAGRWRLALYTQTPVPDAGTAPA